MHVNDPFYFVLLINLQLCRQNYLHKKAQTLLSNDAGYRDLILVFARFFNLGKIKIFLRRY